MNAHLSRYLFHTLYVVSGITQDAPGALAGHITRNGPSLTGTTSIGFAIGDVRVAIETVCTNVIAAQQEVERLIGVVEY